MCLCLVERSKRDDAEIDHDAIAHRLKEDVVSVCVNNSISAIVNMINDSHVSQLEQAGKLQRQVADSVSA